MDEAQTSLPASEAPTSPRVLHKKHPLAIRWFHWINFPILFIMIWSGLMIYWSNQVFTIHLFGHDYGPLFTFSNQRGPNADEDWLYSVRAPGWFPHSLSAAAIDNAGHPMFDAQRHPIRLLWSLNQRLAEGMGWHFLFAWFFGINGLLYVLFLVFSGQWRKIVPRFAALKESIQVVLVDLHLSKARLPVRKYNAAQQIAYTGVILMGLLMLLTGVAIYKPSEQSWLTRLLGGYTLAKFLHFWTTMAFLGFFLVHVGQVIKTGWNNFRGMVTGYELVTPEEKDLLAVEP